MRRNFDVLSRGGYRENERDQLRAAIAANPQDPGERGRLINSAIENNMLDEIPADWAIGVGQGPEEPVRREERYDWTWQTEPTPIALMLYEDRTVGIVDATGGIVGETIFDFNPDPAWTDAGLWALGEALDWAVDSADNFGQLLTWLGERRADQTNNLIAWRVVQTGPQGTTPDLTVGINDLGEVTILFPEGGPLRVVTFASEDELQEAYTSIEECRDDLGEEWND